MPRRYVVDEQKGFAGGLNVTADLHDLAKNEMRQARDARLSEFGAASIRWGSQRTHAAAIGAAVRGGYSWADGGSPQPLEVLVANGRVHDGTFAVPMTWTARGSINDLLETAYPSFAGFRDGSSNALYIADGGPLNKLVGTTVTANIAGSASVSKLAMYNLRLWGAGDASNPETLYWSALSNGDTLGNAGAGGGSAVVRTFSHQDITALLPLGTSLLIFHETGVSRFTGWSQDDFDIDTGTSGISSDVGTIAPRTVVAVGNVGFFLSDRGMYAITESGVEPISTKIDKVIRKLDQSLFSRAWAVHAKATREVWFYLPDIGTYVYNYELKAWTGPWFGGGGTFKPYWDNGGNSAWSTRDDDNRPAVLIGGGDGWVRHGDRQVMGSGGTKFDDILSDGTGGQVLDFKVQCHRMLFGDQGKIKTFRRALVLFSDMPSLAKLHWRSPGQTSEQNALITGGASLIISGPWVDDYLQTAATGEWLGLSGSGDYLDLLISADRNAENLNPSNFSYIRAEAYEYDRRTT